MKPYLSSVAKKHKNKKVKKSDLLWYQKSVKMLGSLKRTMPYLAATSGVLTLMNTINVSECSGEDHIPSLDYGWSHHGAMSSYDYKSIRRGNYIFHLY